jgi:hypothetical protein
MLVNCDQSGSHKIRISFQNGTEKQRGFQGSVDTFAFGNTQYHWHAATISPMSHPESPEEPVIESGEGLARPDGPPGHENKDVSSANEFDLPSASIMIVRGNVAPETR